MKHDIPKKGCGFFHSTVLGGLFFLLSTLQVQAQPFDVMCDLIAQNARLEQNLVVCGDLTVCGELCARIPGVNFECAELIFSSSDLGFTTCATENLTTAQIWNRNAYENCAMLDCVGASNNQFSEIRGVPLLTQPVACARANDDNGPIPTVPYLDFRVPSDFDFASDHVMEVDIHFFTMCRDSDQGTPPGPGVNDVINSGPFCNGAVPINQTVEVTMLADFISDGQSLGSNACGEINATAQKTGVTVSAVDGEFIQYKVTFCIPSSQVASFIRPCDWGRLMWFRTGDPVNDNYEFTVFMGLVAVRYPKMALLCATSCTQPS